jgi:two-component system phosphate regulon sensor histidine kinase PhoR
MAIGDRIKGLLGTGGGEDAARLEREREECSERERTAFAYIRAKINQLLTVMGSMPLRSEELADQTLLGLDPIGIIAESFGQILEHLQLTNEKLRLAQEELQAILATAGVGIVVVDAGKQILAYNVKAKKLFFRQSGNVRGQTCHEALCGSAIPPTECAFEKVIATRAGIHLTNCVYRDRHFDIAATPIKDKHDAITRVVLVYNDITDRKRTEDILRENEEMYRTIFDNAHELIQSMAPDGSFRHVNRAWCETFGYGRDEIVDLSLPDVIHPDHVEDCLTVFEQVLAGQKPGRFTTVFLDKQGRPISLEGDISCSFSAAVPTAVSCILRKIDPRP